MDNELKFGNVQIKIKESKDKKTKYSKLNLVE
jgi:hypothetical protein